MKECNILGGRNILFPPTYFKGVNPQPQYLRSWVEITPACGDKAWGRVMEHPTNAARSMVEFTYSILHFLNKFRKAVHGLLRGNTRP